MVPCQQLLAPVSWIVVYIVPKTIVCLFFSTCFGRHYAYLRGQKGKSSPPTLSYGHFALLIWEQWGRYACTGQIPHPHLVFTHTRALSLSLSLSPIDGLFDVSEGRVS